MIIFRLMPNSKKAKSPEEINKHIIENLGGSVEAHLRDKHIFHEKGLPFYTCIGNKKWAKEFPNGEIHLVRLNINLKTFKRSEPFIRKITIEEIRKVIPQY